METKNFFLENFNFPILSSTTYRKKYCAIIEQEERTKIIEIFKGKNFCLFLDETTDVNGRYILNIFGQVLENTFKKPVLLESIELNKTNSDNIMREIIFLVPKLMNDDISSRKILNAL